MLVRDSMSVQVCFVGKLMLIIDFLCVLSMRMSSVVHGSVCLQVLGSVLSVRSVRWSLLMCVP